MIDTMMQVTNFHTFVRVITLLLIAVVLFVVIRVFISKKAAVILPPATKDTVNIFLKLKAIQLFSEDAAAQIQVVTYVNGRVLQYPAANHKQWLAASEISEKIIPLPVANMYYIRFEVNVNSTKKLEGGPLIVHGASTLMPPEKIQQSISAMMPKLPIAGEYQLYLLSDGSRDLALKALIMYEIYSE